MEKENTLEAEAADVEGASSFLGASRALKPSEAPAFPTANPDSYRNSNLSCLLK